MVSSTASRQSRRPGPPAPQGVVSSRAAPARPAPGRPAPGRPSMGLPGHAPPPPMSQPPSRTQGIVLLALLVQCQIRQS